MAASIADAIKRRRSVRKSNSIVNPRIYCVLKEKYDACIRLDMPADYPNDKFLIETFNHLKLANPNNFTKGGEGTQARYVVTIKGGGSYWDQNFFDLIKYYPEYRWKEEVLPRYPKDVATSEDVLSFFKETEKIHPRTIWQRGTQLLMNGPQPNGNAVGLVFELYIFDAVSYLDNKDFVGAVVAGRPQTHERLKMVKLVDGNDANYDLKLENVCLKSNLKLSQTLNSVLSGKLNNATKDALNMMDEKIGRRVTQTGSRIVAPIILQFPTAVTFGPNGILEIMTALTEEEWKTDDEPTQKKWERTLDNTKYIAVYGETNGIRDNKQGKFFVSSLRVTATQKKRRNGNLVPKVQFELAPVVNGKLKRPNGRFQFLRQGQ